MDKRNRVQELENENISLLEENQCLKQIIKMYEKEKQNRQTLEKRIENMEEILRILHELNTKI